MKINRKNSGRSKTTALQQQKKQHQEQPNNQPLDHQQKTAIAAASTATKAIGQQHYDYNSPKTPTSLRHQKQHVREIKL